MAIYSENTNWKAAFVGRWQNEEGNMLIIKPFWKRCLVRYFRRDGKLLFWNRLKLFFHMFPIGRIGKLDNNELVISLCGVWGPWIHFRASVSEIDNTEILLPEIEPSINDGYENIMGIGWIQPLSPFRRIK